MSKKKSLNPIKKTVETNIVSKPADFRIVAIGASAGGLEALKEFFSNVQAKCPHCFVIVQHLSPDFKSLMAELLAKNTNLPIFEITDKMVIKKGCIYLIPPKKNLTIEGKTLLLIDKPKGQTLNLPIDIFFRSLAKHYKENAICVILSGTGSDGTSGARAVKEVGGMVMVQDPVQAKFDGMPQSAIKTGLVDYILPVELLPAELNYFIDHPKVSDGTAYHIERDEATVNRILNQILNVTKLDFDGYKRPTLVRRIERRISVNKFHTPKQYLDFIYENSAEVHILAREFLIGVTNFFRDFYAWEILEKTIIPELVKSKSNNEILKVWSVGTSTGEEAYSIAILLLEEVLKQKKKIEIKVFATDLKSEHLEIGSRGLYSESIIANVTQARLNKYFKRVGDEYQVIDNLRRTVIFSQHNILKDPPFNKMDIAICRNLLIYMQAEAQKKIIGMLHYSLNMNGTLFLGSSESLGEYKNVFNEIDQKSKLFRNINPAKFVGLEPLSYPNKQKLTPQKPTISSSIKTEIRMAEVMNNAVAEELGLAAVYVDDNFNVIKAVGEFSKFIELPKVGFSVNILEMLPGSISISVGTALRKAMRTKHRIQYKGMKIRKDDSVTVLDVLINPYELVSGVDKYGCLILLTPTEEKLGSAILIDEVSDTTGIMVEELENELKETRESLRTLILEVATSNEELQATNEELLAANEELQSTNEELQSVNEELHTVNAELQQKMEDLSSLNSDMDNLLQSTDIGTIFLDRQLRIRKFTPAARKHFNFRDSDIHRPIHHFSSNFGKDEVFFSDIGKVLDTGRALQNEVKTEDENWFLMRISPYFNNNNSIDGAVISFVDISQLKIATAKIEKSEEKFRILYENAPDMFASFSIDAYLINCNNKMVENLGYSNEEELIGLHISELYQEKELDDLDKRIEEFASTGKVISVFRDLKRKDGSVLSVSANAEQLYDKNGKKTYSVTSFRDVTRLKEIQSKFLSQNLAFEQVLEGTMSGYWDWMIQENTEYLSLSFKKMFGYEDDEMENSPEAWQKIMHPDDLPGVFDKFEKHVQTKGEFKFDNQVRYYHKDGRVLWILCRGKVIEWGENNEPIRMVGSHVDITPLKNIEEELIRSNGELEQFAYVASHDLQEPLNTITAFVQLLEKEYQGKLDADANQYIEFIQQAANRMSSLVAGVLGYSRIGKNNEMEMVDCNQVVNNVTIDLNKRIQELGVKLKVGKLPKLVGDKMELHSLFLNLIGNAIKYRAKDSIPEIEVSAKSKQTHWQFTIKDNGIGIAEKNIDRVFNIFQRLNNDESYEGTGIGLAKCKKIVEIHGGEIWVESKLGKGSSFIFKLKK